MYIPSPFYLESVVLHGGMVSHMQVLATLTSTLHNINSWILTTEGILVLAACS